MTEIPNLSFNSDFSNTDLFARIFVNDVPVARVQTGKTATGQGESIRHALESGSNEIRLHLQSTSGKTKSGSANFGLKVSLDQIGSFPGEGRTLGELSWKQDENSKFPSQIVKSFDYSGAVTAKPWDSAERLSDTDKSQAWETLSKIHDLIRIGKFEEVANYFIPYFEFHEKLTEGKRSKNMQRARFIADLGQSQGGDSSWKLLPLEKENSIIDIVGNSKLILITLKDQRAALCFSPPSSMPGAPEWGIDMLLMRKNGQWFVAY
jgi:hypothetical protein